VIIGTSVVVGTVSVRVSFSAIDDSKI
jgi:hypothetical protein